MKGYSVFTMENGSRWWTLEINLFVCKRLWKETQKKIKVHYLDVLIIAEIVKAVVPYIPLIYLRKVVPKIFQCNICEVFGLALEFQTINFLNTFAHHYKVKPQKDVKQWTYKYAYIHVCFRSTNRKHFILILPCIKPHAQREWKE